VYDVHISKVVERILFDSLSLVSPTLGLTVNGAVSYADSVGEIAHSLRVYKGKVFLLASILCHLFGGPGDNNTS
jgi:hypothetical protein